MAVASRLQWLAANDGMPRGLWPIEWLAVSYSGITSLYLGVLWPQMDHPLGMLADRAYILAATLLVWGIYTLWPCRWMTFVRITAQMSLLCYWYPDTYEFNSTLPNLDHFFARCDAFLFGCQPAMEFHRSCPWPWFSEAVHMGYFSYYPMIVTVMVFFFLYRNKSYEKASFVVLCSFFLYYLVYLVLPVAGPQFYFWAVSPDLIATGQYPPLGTYFNLHTDMLPSPGNPAGLFHRLVEQAQEMGEESHGRLSFLPHRHHAHSVANGLSAKPATVLHPVAVLRPAGHGHGLYPGALPGGCHSRCAHSLPRLQAQPMDFPESRSKPVDLNHPLFLSANSIPRPMPLLGRGKLISLIINRTRNF